LLYISRHHRDLHSFPTRRSSDLIKTDGSIEMRKFLKTEVPGSDPRIAALEQEVSLLKAAKATPITTAVIPAPAATLAKKTKRIGDRKSTRLNSSHLGISYAVFCL